MYTAPNCTCGWAPREACDLHHGVPVPQPREVHSLISELHRVARMLDPEVEEIELDTGLTTRQDIVDRYDARQRTVRRLVRVAHELNSLADDPSGQPTEYGRSDG